MSKFHCTVRVARPVAVWALACSYLFCGLIACGNSPRIARRLVKVG
jgi:hypothetical protein